MKLTCGCRRLDRVLEMLGDWSLISIFGPAGSGKTTFALQASLNVLDGGGRVLFLNTEDELFIDRLYSIMNARRLKVDLTRFHVLKARSFREQHYIITRILPNLEEPYEMVVVDSLTGYFRLELASSPRLDRVLKMMNMQLAHLLSYAENFKAHVIVTGQVRAGEDRDFVANAEKMLRYWSTIVMRVEKVGLVGDRLFEVFRGGGFRGDFKTLRFKVKLGDEGFQDGA